MSAHQLLLLGGAAGGGPVYVDVSDSITLTDAAVLDLFLSDSLTLSDTAYPEGSVAVTDQILLLDAAYREQDQVLLEEVTLPHVFHIVVEDPSVMQDIPLNDALPFRKQIAKEGRRVQINGWTTSMSDITTIRGYADGDAHLLILPTGDSFYVHITDVQTPDDVERYSIKPYQMTLLEVKE